MGLVQVITGFKAFTLSDQPAAQTGERLSIGDSEIMRLNVRLSDEFSLFDGAFHILLFGAGSFDITLWKHDEPPHGLSEKPIPVVSMLMFAQNGADHILHGVETEETLVQ